MNYLNRVVRGRKIGNVIFFQGGTAYNDAVAAAFSQILGKRIIVPPHNGVIGAIGMALIARERMKNAGQASGFRGYDLHQVQFTVRDFVCRACSNYCDMKEFTIEGERTYWGDQCSDKFRKRARSDRKPILDDLVEYREKLLEEVLLPAMGSKPTVGIPRSMFYYDRFPFWCAYFQELGFEVTVSAATDRKISARGEETAVAQPCFPVQVAHGHVLDLLDKKVDYLLIPNIVNAEVAGRGGGFAPVSVEPDAPLCGARGAEDRDSARQVADPYRAFPFWQESCGERTSVRSLAPLAFPARRAIAP